MVKTKRFLGVLLTLIMLIGLFAITSSAAEQSNTADIASGNITLTETDGVKYANNTAYGDVITIIDSDTAEANVLTIQSGEHDVIIDTVTAKQIDIAAGAKLNLTLTGESTITLTESTMAAIHVPEGAELVITENSQGSVTVSADENVLAGHSGNGAGIGGNKSENNGKITIHGGTVTATGGLGAAGIGGGWEASGANIIITGGIVTATGGSSAAGIGGGSTKDGTNITITGGIVTAIGSNDSSGGDFGIGGGGPESAVSESGAGIGGGYSGRGVDITISGGTVIATSETSVGIGGGNNGSMENIFISPEEYSAITVKETEDATEIIGKYTQETDVTAEFKGISAVYMYTTTCGGNHVDEDGDHKCDICDAYIDELHTDEDNNHLCDVCNQVASECVDTNPSDHICDICNEVLGICVDEDSDSVCDICECFFVDIAMGDINLTETDGVKYANGTAYADTITIIDSDTTIAKVLTIESGEHNVTIDSITVKQIKVATGAKLNLTLAGESMITPVDDELAAIHVPEGAELAITENSTGSVTATGAGYAAGIGGGDGESNGKITICGGTVNAATRISGAGIGGGYNGAGTNITITGGTVTATGGSSGAGIGGGPLGAGTNITITGGTVTATGGSSGAGIGGGVLGDGTNITITGGKVLTAGIGSGMMGESKNIFVSPDEYCAITVKETEEATDIIGKYTGKTDVTSEIESIRTLYIFTTTCGGNHFDEDSDHKCDVCEVYIDELHTDEDDNHLCDVCDYVMSECDFDTNNGFCSVCGALDVPELKDNYYQIENAGQLYWFANYINTVDRTANAVLLNDIDLEGKTDGTGRKWTPIGSTGETSNNFRGHFDGQNHTITNLYIDMQRAGLGFFGEVRLGIVENFTIYGDVKLYGDCSYVGGVIGSAPGANGTDVPDHNGATIRNITSYVNVTLVENAHGSSFVGGFIGYANHETIIENCSWYGTLDLGAYRADSGVGGLVGRLYDGSDVTIRNCGAYGTIKTSYKSGTHNNYDTIYIGGLLSFSPSGSQPVLENNLWAGEFINETDLGAKAHLSAFGTLNGGETVINCYAVNSAPYVTTNDQNIGDITTVTSQRLASGEVAYLLQGEQTTDVWGQDLSKENSLPVLGGEKVYLDSENGTYYNEVKVVYGDVDGSGTVDVSDVIKILQNLASSSTTFTDAQNEATDVNGDGNVDVSDVIRILQHLASPGSSVLGPAA